MGKTTTIHRDMRTAAGRKDYAKATDAALILAPDKGTYLTEFRVFMERYEQAKSRYAWRKALRAVIAARRAAIAAELPDLEQIATERLYELVRLYELTQETRPIVYQVRQYNPKIRT